MGLFSWLFGTYSARQIKKITPIVDEIESLDEKFHALSDDEMRAYTDKLREDLKDGKTLDDILPEAFALVREAAERVLGKRPFRVQLIGGILLHQGRIAEMKTGEGKTLVATLPAYLNALKGEGVHIVTVNDYLARRDSEEMGRVYAYLGLTTGLIVHGQSQNEKKAAYAADITYCTNNELGFDYLRDNMVVYKERMVQRGHAFAIVDEVDSILIDEARTPLIISGMSSKSTELYEKADALVRRLSRHVIKEVDKKEDLDTYDEDFIVDEKARTAVLTAHGIEKAEKYFGIENLSDPENAEIYHHVNTAIKAHGVMRADIDYIVKDGAVIIVDTFTGRLMPGRRYNDGLHQAIEAKERVEVQKESRTIATITFQNYFRMYKKLSGMTGTALTEEDEFRQIYSLDVVEVPTNKPMIRIDQNDVVYRTRAGKLRLLHNTYCHAYVRLSPPAGRSGFPYSTLHRGYGRCFPEDRTPVRQSDSYLRGCALPTPPVRSRWYTHSRIPHGCDLRPPEACIAMFWYSNHADGNVPPILPDRRSACCCDRHRCGYVLPVPVSRNPQQCKDSLLYECAQVFPPPDRSAPEVHSPHCGHAPPCRRRLHRPW